MKKPILLHGRKVVITDFIGSDITEEYIKWLNDPAVVRYSNQRFIKHTHDTCSDYLSSFKGSENLFMSIRTLENNHLIGTATAYMNKQHRTVDVGIMIGNKSDWGMGYGQDAWNTITDWLLRQDEVRKLTAGTLACNHSMIKLLERSGMHHEATREKQEIIDFTEVDILYYAKFSI